MVIVSMEAGGGGICAVVAERHIAMAMIHAIMAATGALRSMCFLSEPMRNVMVRSPIAVKALARLRGAMSQT